jgi:hypothetical protein
MALALEGKSFGSDQKTVLRGELLIWRTKNQATDQGTVQLKDSNWTLDPRLKWALERAPNTPTRAQLSF